MPNSIHQLLFTLFHHVFQGLLTRPDIAYRLWQPFKIAFVGLLRLSAEIMPQEWVRATVGYGLTYLRTRLEEVPEEQVREKSGINTIKPPELRELVTNAHVVSPLLAVTAFRPVLAHYNEANLESMGITLSLGASSAEELYARLTRSSLLIDLTEVICIPYLQVLVGLQSVAKTGKLPEKSGRTLGDFKFSDLPEGLYTDTLRLIRNAHCHRSRRLRDDGVFVFEDTQRGTQEECVPEELQELVLGQIELHRAVVGAHARLATESLYGLTTKAGLLNFLDRFQAVLISNEIKASNPLGEAYDNMFATAPEAEQKDACRYIEMCG